MCGIFGLISVGENRESLIKTQGTVNKLFLLSESRGKEASGMAVIYDHEINLMKAPIPSHLLIKHPQYKAYWHGLRGNFDLQKPFCVIGHARLVTNGAETDDQNNQPVKFGQTVGVHNGIVVNEKDLWQKELKRKPLTSVDTEVLMALVDRDAPKIGIKLALKKSLELIEGAASIAVINREVGEMGLATNTGSLYYGVWKEVGVIFASERYILEKIRVNKIVNLKPGKVKIFKLEMVEKKKETWKRQIIEIPITVKKTDSGIIKGGGINTLGKLKKHDFPYSKIKAIKRCKRCILPITTPFITFNDRGVCNYCLEHKPFTCFGRDNLEKIIAPFRSDKGEPDCLVGFSGGRDSSYGLAYLKEELKLNPIAYTFDWGMLSDYGRQNAARVTGKLGVEHILVSADIPKKLLNIRLNIEAWCKKPDLGMVPLFMAGDKQSEFYMNELKRKTGIKLVIYCRGNEYENEEFKSGSAGVKGADPKGVMHDLPWAGKLKLAVYYGKQFVNNPRYLNKSLIDSVSAYLATYIIPHDYLYLWHYVPWNETQVVDKLRRDFNWQTPLDTTATWRIDDGSPPFYNYIYYMVQGFTENDSLRSHQIRQGDLDRNTAWKLASEENRPRFEGLQWYFDRIGMDGDKVLRVIDNIPKLY